MLTTCLDVLKTVAERYERATRLARNETSQKCVYAHHLNGVGCAIGCLLAPEIADLLDSLGGEGIHRIYRLPAVKYHINQVVDVNAVGVDNLTAIQNMHDQATDVDDFRSKLNTEIAQWEGKS